MGLMGRGRGSKGCGAVRRLGWATGVALGMTFGAAPAAAQIPTEFTNLQHLSADTDRATLVGMMRRMSLSLGVRCQYCHVGGDGVSFEGVDFASDDDPDKVKARWMLAMVDDLNQRLATDLPDRDDPPVEMTCKTCHRGIPRPKLLAQELRIVLDTQGPDSLAAAYDRAREALEAGRYDFREWEVNLLAEELEAEGRPDHALAVWELNLEHHPESLPILSTVARLHEEGGRPERAIEAYERILQIAPENAQARARLDALRGG
ncbi:MAG: c-type cytochrome [Longimicrobiales bacterium]